MLYQQYPAAVGSTLKVDTNNMCSPLYLIFIIYFYLLYYYFIDNFFNEFVDNFR